MNFMQLGEEKLEIASLGGLPPDFYNRIADYLSRIDEENQRFLTKNQSK